MESLTTAMSIVDRAAQTSAVRRELELAISAARTLPVEQLARLIADLEEIRVIALARLTTPAPISKADELVGIEEAARRLNMSTAYLYRHHSQLPFARHIGRRLLFSSTGIDCFIAARR